MNPPPSDQFALMFDRAKAARQAAYVPYSQFPVGVCFLSAEGNYFDGCNVENAAYPVGHCAEVSAIGTMITAGDRRIAEIVIVGGGALCTPCGACRQRLAEFAAPEVAVHVCGPEGLRRTLMVGELLPAGFVLDSEVP